MKSYNFVRALWKIVQNMITVYKCNILSLTQEKIVYLNIFIVRLSKQMSIFSCIICSCRWIFNINMCSTYSLHVRSYLFKSAKCFWYTKGLLSDNKHCMKSKQLVCWNPKCQIIYKLMLSSHLIWKYFQNIKWGCNNQFNNVRLQIAVFWLLKHFNHLIFVGWKDGILVISEIVNILIVLSLCH